MRQLITGFSPAGVPASHDSHDNERVPTRPAAATTAGSAHPAELAEPKTGGASNVPVATVEDCRETARDDRSGNAGHSRYRTRAERWRGGEAGAHQLTETGELADRMADLTLEEARTARSDARRRSAGRAPGRARSRRRRLHPEPACHRRCRRRAGVDGSRRSGRRLRRDRSRPRRPNPVRDGADRGGRAARPAPLPSRYRRWPHDSRLRLGGAGITARQTILALQRLSEQAETISYVYVTDAEDHLLGVLSLRGWY